MSPVLLLLDLLVLVVGLPLLWTLRDLAPHGLAAAGGLRQLARGGVMFDGRESPLAEPEAIAEPSACGSTAVGIFFNRA